MQIQFRPFTTTLGVSKKSSSSSETKIVSVQYSTNRLPYFAPICFGQEYTKQDLQDEYWHKLTAMVETDQPAENKLEALQLIVKQWVLQNMLYYPYEGKQKEQHEKFVKQDSVYQAINMDNPGDLNGMFDGLNKLQLKNSTVIFLFTQRLFPQSYPVMPKGFTPKEQIESLETLAEWPPRCDISWVALDIVLSDFEKKQKIDKLAVISRSIPSSSSTPALKEMLEGLAQVPPKLQVTKLIMYGDPIATERFLEVLSTHPSNATDNRLAELRKVTALINTLSDKLQTNWKIDESKINKELLNWCDGRNNHLYSLNLDDTLRLSIARDLSFSQQPWKISFLLFRPTHRKEEIATVYPREM